MTRCTIPKCVGVELGGGEVRDEEAARDQKPVRIGGIYDIYYKPKCVGVEIGGGKVRD